MMASRVYFRIRSALLIGIVVAGSCLQSSSTKAASVDHTVSECLKLPSESQALGCLQATDRIVDERIQHRLNAMKSASKSSEKRLRIDRDQASWERKALEVCSKDESASNLQNLFGQTGYLQCQLKQKGLRERALVSLAQK